MYIMIGLERTNMAIYTYVTKTLLEHSKYEYWCLIEHKIATFGVFFVDWLWPAQNFCLDNAYYGRSWKDKYGNIYICKGKPSRTFETWLLRYFFRVFEILSKFVKIQNHFVCEW